MATAYTSLLGLALPVTGELQGTWGTTVNDAITSLLDTAVAGATTLNTDTDVTLTTTTGAANQARQAIILWTANGSVTRNITAPAQSKIYVVINATAGTQSIVIRGAGPTSGVTLLAGERAIVAWNGSDFVKVSTFGGSSSFTNVTVTGTTTLSGLTASTALALNGSKEVVSVTNTGTGNNVLSASPTLTGTVAGASLQLSSLTSGRVTYAGASGLLQDSANLTFNGTDLTVSGAVNAGSVNATTLDLTNLEVTNIKAKDGTASMTLADATGVATFSANPILNAGTANGVLYLNASKVATSGTALVFDGSNLGIGVTPSAWFTSGRAIQLLNNGILSVNPTEINILSNAFLNANASSWIYQSSNAASRYNQAAGIHAWYTAPSGTAGNTITFTQAMTLDASNNLLIGTTSAVSGSKLVVDTGDATIYGVRVGRGAGAVSSNTAVGASALNANTTGSLNTAVGFEAGRTITSGTHNTVIGYRSAYALIDGGFNVFVGRETGASASSASGNTFIGNFSGNATTSSANTFVGSTSGFSVTSGAKNTIIGAYSGNQDSLDIRTASNNIVLSDGDGNARQYYSGASNFWAWRNGGSERMRLDSSGNLGIGTTSPAAPLHVAYSSATDGGTFEAARFSRVGGSSSGVNPRAIGISFSDQDNATLLGGMAGVRMSPSNDFRGGLGFYVNTTGQVSAFSSLTEVVRIFWNGNVGIGTTAPSYLLSLGGNSARTVGMERHTTANTAGNNLTLLAGGATSAATDKNGGNLVLSSGTATGSGSSIITFLTTTAGSAGTADRSPTEKMRLDGSGNLGIGVTPSYPLDVRRTLSSDGGIRLINAVVSAGPYTGSNYGVYSVVNSVYSTSIAVYGEATQPDTGGPGTAFGGYFKVLSGGAAGTGLGSTTGLRVESTAATGPDAYGIYSSTVAGAANVYPLTLVHAASTIFSVASTGNVTSSGTATATKFVPTGNVTAGNGMYLPTTNTLAWSTNGSERMRLDASGNLGLGTSSPASIGANITTLDIRGATGGGVRFGVTGAENGALYGRSTEVQLAAISNVPLLFLTNNTERMRIDTSGNVGIGTAPSAWQSGKALEVGFLGTSLWAFQQGSSYRTTNAYYDGAWKYGGTGGASLYAQEGGLHTWSSAASGSAGGSVTFTPLLIVDRNKTLALQGATSQTGTGITFPATQSASSDANTLDDYEEGTWTPSLGGTATYTARTGNYIKVGNLVRCFFDITVNAIGTGDINTISGFPFTAAFLEGGSISYFTGAATSVYWLTVQMNNATTNCDITGATTLGASINTAITVFQNGTRVSGTVVYSV